MCDAFDLEKEFEGYLESTCEVQMLPHRILIDGAFRDMAKPIPPKDYLLGFFDIANLGKTDQERDAIKQTLGENFLGCSIHDIGTVEGLLKSFENADYQVLHLAMHGHQETRAGAHTLQFTERNTPVEPEILARAIASGCKNERGSKSNGITCVVLNACRSSEIARLPKEAGVLYVVSWKAACHDEAKTFAERFYRKLARAKHKCFRSAVEAATSALEPLFHGVSLWTSEFPAQGSWVHRSRRGKRSFPVTRKRVTCDTCVLFVTFLPPSARWGAPCARPARGALPHHLGF